MGCVIEIELLIRYKLKVICVGFERSKLMLSSSIFIS